MADRRARTGTIQNADEARRVLAEVNAAGLQRSGTSALAHAVRAAPEAEVGADASQVVAVAEQLRPLVPWPGLRRGATIAAVGSTSLVMLILSAAMRQGSFAAVVGLPQFGALAAREVGLTLDRLILVPKPGPQWPTVVGALLDGMDLVVVGAPAGVAEGTVRSLQSRARQRGAVLLPVTAWPGSDVVIEVTGRRWEGLGLGRGRLRRQHLELRATGRGKAARPTTAEVALPPGAGPYEAPSFTPPPPSPPSRRDDVVPPASESPGWDNLTPSPDPDLWGDLVPIAAASRRKRR